MILTMLECRSAGKKKKFIPGIICVTLRSIRNMDVHMAKGKWGM